MRIWQEAEVTLPVKRLRIVQIIIRVHAMGLWVIDSNNKNAGVGKVTRYSPNSHFQSFVLMMGMGRIVSSPLTSLAFLL